MNYLEKKEVDQIDENLKPKVNEIIYDGKFIIKRVKYVKAVDYAKTLRKKPNFIIISKPFDEVLIKPLDETDIYAIVWVNKT